MKHEDRMRLYTAGLTDREIAEELGVTRSAIAGWRYKYGLEYNGPGKAPDEKLFKRRKKLYDKGLPDKEIALAEGVKVAAISIWRKKYGLKPNKPKRKPRRYNGDPVCITCSKATAVICPYFAIREPEDGLKAVGIKPSDVHVMVSTNGKTYKVLKCPQYKRGPLPPPAWKVVGQ